MTFRQFENYNKFYLAYQSLFITSDQALTDENNWRGQSTEKILLQPAARIFNNKVTELRRPTGTDITAKRPFI